MIITLSQGLYRRREDHGKSRDIQPRKLGRASCGGCFHRGLGNCPEGLCKDPQGREEHIKINLRGILQLFQVKVFIFPDRVEIKGAIPTQLIEFPEKHRKNTAPIISSPSQLNPLLQPKILRFVL